MKKRPTLAERKIWSEGIVRFCRKDYRSWVTELRWTEYIEQTNKIVDMKEAHRGLRQSVEQTHNYFHRHATDEIYERKIIQKPQELADTWSHTNFPT